MNGIIDKVHDPSDIRKMSTSELKQLAQDIRELMVNTVCDTGGHLASSLGVVEVTLALHCVFDTPEDKIIWDVGHQSYAHKMITGRREQFNTLRQHGGLSGFPKRDESVYDVFATGHSSTSISAALGMALARDQRGEDFHIVAVIGDGSLTAGMAFEALNYAGDSGKNLIVVLNDNKMSIGKNVGALSTYLSRVRTDPVYFKGKEEMENLMKRLPHGSSVWKVAERLKDSIKYLVVPGMLFEELGFTYLGPIDGHDIEAVKSVLSSAKTLKGPVMVHLLTKKGKGYTPAERKPDAFHGIGLFDAGTGIPSKKEGAPSYTSVFSRTMIEVAKTRPEVVAVTAAMPGGTGLDAFGKQYPQRFFDVGIAEQNAVTMAAGMSCEGLKPVVAIYSTFLQRAFDQVVHDVCMQKLPVVFALDRGGLVGEDGETHQGVFDLSYLRLIPNMVLMVPKDENELRHMLVTALDHQGPIALRYPRGSGIGVKLDETPEPLPIGKAVIEKQGEDVAIFAVGPHVYTALQARDLLGQMGIKTMVVNCRFVKPLDGDLLSGIAGRVKRIVTVEENVLKGGFGSAVLELLESRGIKGTQVVRMGLPDKFIEHGATDVLRMEYGLSADAIVNTVKEHFQF